MSVLIGRKGKGTPSRRLAYASMAGDGQQRHEMVAFTPQELPILYTFRQLIQLYMWWSGDILGTSPGFHVGKHLSEVTRSVDHKSHVYIYFVRQVLGGAPQCGRNHVRGA